MKYKIKKMIDIAESRVTPVTNELGNTYMIYMPTTVSQACAILYDAGYRKQSDTINEFAEKLRIAIDKITDTHGITELNLYTKVYVRKPAVMDIINELVAEYGVTVWR